MVSFSSYYFLCAFVCALKYLFFAFTNDFKGPLMKKKKKKKIMNANSLLRLA